VWVLGNIFIEFCDNLFIGLKAETGQTDRIVVHKTALIFSSGNYDKNDRGQ
jgi:hypothetical protein